MLGEGGLVIALVTGAASSGKSTFAERLACALPAPRTYLATMRHGDAETEARIKRHRAQRHGLGFRTLEAERLESEGGLPLCGTVLLEDLGNLVANEWPIDLDALLACENVVVVGNEVGGDGGACACGPGDARYGAATSAYIKRLGALSCRIAARADVVVEVVAGIPLVAKGTLPEDAK